MPPVIAAVASAAATAATEVAAMADIGLTIGESAAIYSAVYAVVDVGVTLGLTVGLNLLLAPKPPGLPQVQTPLKQAIPPRRSGYGRARLSGYYMLYTAIGPDSYNVLALHDGRIDGYERYYLNEDEVRLNPTYDGVISPDGRKYAVFDNSGGGRGDYRVFITTTLGDKPSTQLLADATELASIWTAQHRGDGVAAMAVACRQSKQKDQQTNFPFGLPLPSTAARLLRLYDPRLNGLDRIGDAWASPWNWSSNGALAVLDYLVDPDHGMGLDFARRIKPAIETWITGANVCDEQVEVARTSSYLTGAAVHGFHNIRVFGTTGLSIGMPIDIGFGTPAAETLTVTDIGAPAKNGVLLTLSANMAHDHAEGDQVTWAAGADGTGTQPRYAVGGVYEHTTAPADVIAQLLAASDGWLGQRGDGALVYYAGKYYEPTVTLTDDHVTGYQVRYFLPDEETVNQLLPTYCEPNQRFNEVDAGEWNNSPDQAARGRIRSQPMPLPWVPAMSQARRLAKRAMSRYAAEVRGQVKTNLYGMTALGERFIRLQVREHTAIRNLVVEISKVQIDLSTLTLTFDWVAADPTADEWSTADEITIVPIAPPTQAPLDAPTITAVAVNYASVNSTGDGATLTLTIDNPFDGSADWILQWSPAGANDWTPIKYNDVADGTPVTLTTGFVPSGGSLDLEVAYVTAGGQSPWSAIFTVSVPVAPSSAAAVLFNSAGAAVFNAARQVMYVP